MRIRSLVITGFGPYASRQVLDFEGSLRNEPIFVVTGNTGAGKTTIFDAIAFALYGEASGTGREGSSLRSDFADPATPTEVELSFSLRGEEYYVKRSPAYERAKQRGTGTTKESALAEFRLPQGKVITGAKEVTAQVESVLGITADQFRQLVMIPQGEFRKLLTADASSKEEIFRKIFGTELYKKIQTIARERAKQIESAGAQLRRDRLGRIRSFMTKDAALLGLIAAAEPDVVRIMESFSASLDADTREEKKLAARNAEADAAIEKLSQEFALAEGINRKLEDCARSRKELDALSAQSVAQKNKEASAARSRSALGVSALEKRASEKSKECADLDSRIRASKENLASFESALSSAEKSFAAQKAREPERAALEQSVRDLAALKQKALQYRSAELSVRDLEINAASATESVAALEKTVLEHEKAAADAEKVITQAAALKEARSGCMLESQSAAKTIESLAAISEAIGKWADADKKHRDAATVFEAADAAFAKARAEFDRMENLFRRSQAGILAQNLEDGEPCPVCGSTAHPRKAAVEDASITEESVKKSRELFEKEREKREKILNELTSIKSGMNALYETAIVPSASALGFSADGDMAQLQKAVGVRAQETDAAKRSLDAKIRELDTAIAGEKDAELARDAAKKGIKAARAATTSKNAELLSFSKKLASAKTVLETLRADFAGTVRSSSELDAEIAQKNTALAALRKEAEAAEKALSDVKTRRDTEKGTLESLLARRESAVTELSSAQADFAAAIAKAGFADEADYRASCRSEDEIKTAEQQIAHYRLSLERAMTICSSLEAETKDVSPIDLSALTAALSKAKADRDLLEKELSGLRVRIGTNSSIVKECAAYSRQLDAADAGYRTAGALSKLVNGDNDKKISFERFVLAAYFEDIIAAANLRFGRMTDSRFILQRAVESGDKRKNLGLELEVYDNYTGKSRSVSTLSGGESFKASLCLALGMADVVQSHTGGIQLDTMFIDEGFGTLDPESLDNAIECLVELKSAGRLVGIISHVPELKERIGAKLEVISTSRGSSARFAV